MKKNMLKTVNTTMYVLAIIILVLIWTLGVQNVSAQPILTVFVKLYAFVAIIIVALNLVKRFSKKK